VSFVEKALNRLKQREQPMAPLGEYRESKDPSAHRQAREADERPEASDHHTAGAEPDRPRAGGRTVAVDRNRLRDEGFLAPEKYHRQLADEYRRIKRPLIANAFGIGVPQLENGNLILVSSAISGEGKTHTCLNLALSLSAERDRTVLLVDGDVPKPHISRLFGVADQPGLLDALGDRPPRLDSMLIRTDIPRLSVLPAGKWTDHAPELLASVRMGELCREISARYPDRIIIFDSPPLLEATEAQAISTHVGQVVVVIAANITSRESVRAAIGLLDEQKPINAVLNKSRGGLLGGYYYRGYGYGAHSSAESQVADEPRS
jgi:protein-tyrosine kinase